MNTKVVWEWDRNGGTGEQGNRETGNGETGNGKRVDFALLSTSLF